MSLVNLRLPAIPRGKNLRQTRLSCLWLLAPHRTAGESSPVWPVGINGFQQLECPRVLARHKWPQMCVCKQRGLSKGRRHYRPLLECARQFRLQYCSDERQPRNRLPCGSLAQYRQAFASRKFQAHACPAGLSSDRLGYKWVCSLRPRLCHGNAQSNI